MAATLALLEARLNRLEAELRDLRKAAGIKEPKPWYDQIHGTFNDDPGFDEIVRLGKQIRDADHGIPAPRRKKTSSKPSAKPASRKGRR